MISREELSALQQIRNREGHFFSNLDSALKVTIEADYRQLAKIIDAEPELMFVETTARDINGQNIITSPLRYALEKLDTLAWKYFESVCQRHPENMDAFIATVCSVLGTPDLTPLYNAYIDFINLGIEFNKAHWSEHHNSLINEGKSPELDTEEFQALKKSWLALGMQQRYELPRHMLKDLCHTASEDIIFNDVILMRVNGIKFELEEAKKINETELGAKLKQIMRRHNDCTMILLNQGKYYVLYLGLDNNIICFDNNRSIIVPLVYEVRNFVYKKLEFPDKDWTPVIKNGEQNYYNLIINTGEGFGGGRRGMWKFKKHLLFPLNSQTLYYEINFVTEQAKVKYLLPLKLNAGLGYDFALARGYNGMCCGFNDPRGQKCHLFAKAAEDYEGIQALVIQRLMEREELRKSYSHGIKLPGISL